MKQEAADAGSFQDGSDCIPGLQICQQEASCEPEELALADPLEDDPYQIGALLLRSAGLVGSRAASLPAL